MPLTDIQIRKTPPKDKAYKLADGGGMFLLVQPNGQKYWRLAYRFMGKQKLISFGVYPEVTLGKARDMRQEARQQLRDGIDPSAKRRDDKVYATFNASNTFKTVAEDWQSSRKPKWTDGHAEKIKQRLERHAYPAFGDKPINSIGTFELLSFFKKLEEAGTEISHRMLQYVSGVFQFGVLTQRCLTNPCFALRGVLKAHKTKHYPVISTRDMPEFIKNLNEVKTSQQNKLAIHLLMLTFVRQGELRQAKWADIDWNTREWRIPATTTKMRVEHIVPLSDQALTILEALKPLTLHNPYGLLFPSQNRQKNPGMSENTLNDVLKKMGYAKRMVAHGFRALASTHLNETGKFRSDVIERQLAHMPRDQIRASYNHADYMMERKAMMTYWGHYVSTMHESSNVVRPQFKRGAA